MNQTSSTPLNTLPADKDLVELARPGHGIPSQDPSSTAQFPLGCEDAGRENKSVLMGGGLVAGAATGAAVGIAVAGPVGVVVGGTVGAVVGAFGAAAAGTIMSPGDSCDVHPSPAGPGPIDPSPVGPGPIDPSPISPSPMDPLPENPDAPAKTQR